MRMCKWKWLVR